MQRTTVARVATNAIEKGDVLEVARFAATQSAKNSSSLLPLSACTMVSYTSVDFVFCDVFIDIEVTVHGAGVSVEVPALSAVAVGALSIYDMCKSADRTMVISPVELVDRPEQPRELP